MTYKTKKTFEERQQESNEILTKYPDRIPIIIEKLVNKNDTVIPTIDKNKYLVPKDLTIGQLIYVIRKRLKLTAEKAIFVFCSGNILRSDALISQEYDKYKDKDGFLYILYSGESTFG